MAKKKLFDTSIFIDEYELEIEQTVKRNLDRITDDVSIKKSHTKIAEILNREKQLENKYLNYEVYRTFVEKLKKEKKEKEDKIKATTTTQTTPQFNSNPR